MPNAGHADFWDDAAAFKQHLRAFARVGEGGSGCVSDLEIDILLRKRNRAKLPEALIRWLDYARVQAMLDSSSEPQSQDVGSIAANAVGDQPTANDSLGFTPYVEAIAAFLTSEKTRPPLTMSVEGEWGSGKSSFMLQLEQAIRGPARSYVFVQGLPKSLGGFAEDGSVFRAAWSALRKNRRRITIQFNAWRHDKQDALWAAFALKFAKDLRGKVGFFRALQGDALLFAKRLKGVRGWLEILVLLVSLLLLAGGLAGLYRFVGQHPTANIRRTVSILVAESHDQQVPDTEKKENKDTSYKLPWPYEFLFSKGRWGILLSLALGGLVRFHKQVKLPISIEIEKYLTKPDYRSRIAFIETFHEDFSRVLAAYAKGQRIFVFIDDLDRCDVPKAAELIQAINLMIGDTGELIFILGMDREKVAAGITQKYKDLLPYLPEFNSADASQVTEALYFGYSYLEKFIQLSFSLPVLSGEAALRQFLSSLSIDTSHANFRSRIAKYWSTRLSVGLRQKSSADSGPTEAKVALGTTATNAASEEVVISLRIRVESDSERILRTAEMVAPIFENNPRKLKQFLNSFRMALFLCSEFGLLDKRGDRSPTTPEQVGKFVAMTLRFPGLKELLVEDPRYLYALETGAQMGMKSPWLRDNGVKRVLQFGVGSNEKPFDPAVYSLEKFPAAKLFSILPKVPPARLPRPDAHSSTNRVAGPAIVSFEVTQSHSALDINPRSESVLSSATDESEFSEEASPTITPATEGNSTNDARFDLNLPIQENAARLIQSRLAAVDPAMKSTFEEALRLLLAEGSVNEYFGLNDLKRRGHAQNWANLFAGMQRSTNLVQPVPGQGERRPEDTDWQIKPELRSAVAAYFQLKPGGATSASA